MAEYYAVVRSDNSLLHYGVKGMKWGVRKAIAKGNEKALDRHFRRAAKKLLKLQDIGLNSKKYAAKAAAYGAAAAGTGTIAGIGAKGISNHYLEDYKKYMELGTQVATDAYKPASGVTAGSLIARANRSSDISKKIDNWANSQSSIFKPRDHIVNKDGKYMFEKTKGLKKGDVLRLGTGLVSLGLGAKAAQNAYRAANGAKYRQKAMDFKNAMDDVFSGTKYAGQYVAYPRKRKFARLQHSDVEGSKTAAYYSPSSDQWEAKQRKKNRFALRTYGTNR